MPQGESEEEVRKTGYTDMFYIGPAKEPGAFIDINEETLELARQAEAAKLKVDALSLEAQGLLRRLKARDRKTTEEQSARNRAYQHKHRISLSMSVEEARAIEAFLRSLNVNGVRVDGVTENFRGNLCRRLRNRERALEGKVVENGT